MANITIAPSFLIMLFITITILIPFLFRSKSPKVSPITDFDDLVLLYNKTINLTKNKSLIIDYSSSINRTYRDMISSHITKLVYFKINIFIVNRILSPEKIEEYFRRLVEITNFSITIFISVEDKIKRIYFGRFAGFFIDEKNHYEILRKHMKSFDNGNLSQELEKTVYYIVSNVNLNLRNFAKDSFALIFFLITVIVLVNLLRKINLKSNEPIESIICSICLDSIAPSDQSNRSLVKTLRCGHSFHSGCINSWLQNNNRCPICRRTLVNLNM